MLKPKRVSGLFVGLVVLVRVVHAQVDFTEAVETMESRGYLGQNRVLIGRELPPGGLEGSVYLFSEALPGEVVFYDSLKVASEALRLDLKNQSLEVKHRSKTFAIEAERVRRFSLSHPQGTEQVYLNLREFTRNPEFEREGFGLLLASGKVQLVEVTKLKTLPPTYVQGLDVGSRDSKIVRERSFFVSRDNVFREIRNKSDLKFYFPDAYNALKGYLKEHKTSFKDRDHWVSLVTYWNSL